jgi:lysosomal-associated membrane protein 1/2
MKYTKQIVIVFVLCLGLALGLGEDAEIDKKKTTTTSTTTEVTSSSTVTEPTTSDVTTERTTESTTQSTTVPVTTTISTSTVPQTTTSTTTVAPTTTAPIITTPSPTPKPSIGLWNWTDASTNQTCVMVQMAIQLEFNYTANDGSLKNTTHNVPYDVHQKIEGTCGNDTQSITVQTGFCNFTIEFTKENDKFELSSVLFSIDTTGLPDSKNETVTISHKKNEFVTPLARSYYCTKQQTLSANETSPVSSTAKIIMSHVQLEAFHIKTKEFSAAKDCDSSDSTDVVPIAVGISLAALVVVVLIAYLVARRRSAARGYMSM